ETIKCNDLRSILLLKEDFHICQPVKSSQLFVLAKHRRVTDDFLVKYNHQKQKTGIIMELILESKICIKCLCAKAASHWCNFEYFKEDNESLARNYSSLFKTNLGYSSLSENAWISNTIAITDYSLIYLTDNCRFVEGDVNHSKVSIVIV
uniref:Uncharacterized protein n=1 Tax=Glossina palpalis gambiensis TaxID=67801 RepID=A0A1B0AYI7_9MUSC